MAGFVCAAQYEVPGIALSCSCRTELVFLSAQYTLHIDGGMHERYRMMRYYPTPRPSPLCRMQAAFNNVAQVLSSGARSPLVVAHNACNQALIATALGLPPAYFRKLQQSNAAVTLLEITPMLSSSSAAAIGNGAGSSAGSGAGNGRNGASGSAAQPDVRVKMLQLNNSPLPPFKADDAETGAMPRLVLVCCSAGGTTAAGAAATASDAGSRAIGSGASSALDSAANARIAGLLQGLPLTAGVVAASGAAAALALAAAIAERQSSSAGASVPIYTPYVGGLNAGSDEAAAWEAAGKVWAEHFVPFAGASGGQTLAVLADAPLHAALVCKAWGLGQDSMRVLGAQTGGISMFEFTAGIEGAAAARCINYTGHLAASPRSAL